MLMRYGSAWSLTMGSLPQFSRFPHFPPKLWADPQIEESLWIPYTDDGTSEPIRVLSVLQKMNHETDLGNRIYIGTPM